MGSAGNQLGTCANYLIPALETDFVGLIQASIVQEFRQIPNILNFLPAQKNDSIAFLYSGIRNRGIVLDSGYQ